MKRNQKNKAKNKKKNIKKKKEKWKKLIDGNRNERIIRLFLIFMVNGQDLYSFWRRDINFLFKLQKGFQRYLYILNNNVFLMFLKHQIISFFFAKIFQNRKYSIAVTVLHHSFSFWTFCSPSSLSYEDKYSGFSFSYSF